MDELSQWLHDEGFVQFKEAKTLNEEISKTDPETEPYQSKYKARAIWKGLKAKLEDFIEDRDTIFLSEQITKESVKSVEPTAALDDINLVIGEESTNGSWLSNTNGTANDLCKVSIRALLTIVTYELGANFVECEEIGTGDDYLNKCLGFTEDHCLEPDMISVQLAVLNQLSVIDSNRGVNNKALERLKVAESLYQRVKAEGINCPLYYGEVWSQPDEYLTEKTRSDNFEKLYTLTLYYLAQVYGCLNELELSGRYCHITLARQMKTGQYEPLDWSLNCATLSQYYVTKDQYAFSRYCLACAETVNKEAFEKFNPESFDDTNERERAEEKLEKSRADIWRCWAKYGLNILKMSHTKKLQECGQTDEKVEVRNDEKLDDEDLTHLKFGSIDVGTLEQQVTEELVQDYHNAKVVFQFSQKCLNKAKEFYKLDGFVTDFVEISQDVSQFYKYLAFFENDFEVRCKMHKRRIDMLNAILIELNPQHFLIISRQLSFEIGETYAEMVDLKKAIVEEDPSKLSVNRIQKINALVLKSVQYFQGFIDSYKRDGILPEKFEDDAVRGLLLTVFLKARLYSKYLTTDRQTKIEYMSKEKECYEYLVNYCDSNPDMPKGIMDEELDMAREMIALFNVKMNNALDKLD